ncbi:MAG: DUF2163 domain-containing protein [Burkholderiales bacterium]
MKSVSQGFIDHLALQSTCLCHLWKVIRQDGKVFGFTDHPRDLSYPDLTYLSSTGFDCSAIETAGDLSVDNLEIDTIVSSFISEEDVEAGIWDHAEVRFMLGVYADPGLGTLGLRRGWIGEVGTGRLALSAELRGLMQALQFDVGRLYSPECDADLGDARCRVNLADHEALGIVTSVSGNRIFTGEPFSQGEGWFAGSRLIFRSGANLGIAMEVKYFAAGRFELQQPMPRQVSIGDEFWTCKGCDKSRASCMAFGNLDNFRGYPDVPGVDRLVSGK